MAVGVASKYLSQVYTFAYVPGQFHRAQLWVQSHLSCGKALHASDCDHPQLCPLGFQLHRVDGLVLLACALKVGWRCRSAVTVLGRQVVCAFPLLCL